MEYAETYVARARVPRAFQRLIGLDHFRLNDGGVAAAMAISVCTRNQRDGVDSAMAWTTLGMQPQGSML